MIFLRTCSFSVLQQNIDLFWLCFRIYVALKACVGMKEPIWSNEVKTLERIHRQGRGKPGYEHIIELQDAFIIQGPNSFHEIIITEVAIPLYEIGRNNKLCQRMPFTNLSLASHFFMSRGSSTVVCIFFLSKVSW